MKRGDVVIVVVSGELGKPRPAVVVQADELGDATTTVLVCPMSSEIREADNLRPVFEPTTGSGLRTHSQVMADKITALRRDRIRRKIGKLDKTARESLDRALLILLGLAR